jgi:1-acyl-sn-glycerol-3-phosphate acyltransferase
VGVRKAPWFRRLTKVVLGTYMRVWHDVEVHGTELLPPHGPALMVCNHASLIDTAALMGADPYPDSTTVVKASMFRVPIVRQVLHAWGAIPVERSGHDVGGLRRLLAALNEGRVVGLAAEGRRTRSGHLERIHPVVARLAAVADVPIIPVGISGSFQALPAGAWFPRRHKITVRVGTPFRLASGTTGEEAARGIGEAIAALLAAEQQPISQPQELEKPASSVLAHASGRRPRCTESRT